MSNNTGTRLGRVGRAVAGAAHLLVVVIVVGLSAPASARSYASSSLTLPSGTFELGLGLGVGHLDAIDYTGLGINMELGYGLNNNLELRFRTGLRFGTEGRVTNADYFGRPVETETYNLGNDTLAHPEIGLRFALNKGGTAEVALDTRLYVPVDGDLGFLIGLPVSLRLDRLRLDTGVFIPIILTEPDTTVLISIPLHLWLRLDSGTFLGPMTGIVFRDEGDERIPFGIGAGTPLAYDADLRFWLLFPNIDDTADNFGVGVGLYVTF
jgi:hypothetical protein